MLNWNTPDKTVLTDSAWNESRRFGSDTAAANIILLGAKYNTKIAMFDGVLFRYYDGGKPNRSGYGFPLFRGDSGFDAIFGLLRDDAKDRGVPLAFCLCDERQKAAIDTVCRVEWKCTEDDSDYIYKRESLAALAGKKLHRKRNHINNFMRLYDDVEYRPLSAATGTDALEIAKKWLEERGDRVSADERGEFDCITRALGCMDELGIFGGVLYVGKTPVAMTAASAISEAVTDVHYEKSYGEYAANGAFAVINQKFSESVSCEYINREEDMGIAGLRTAKESYFPAFKVKKYYGVCKC